MTATPLAPVTTTPAEGPVIADARPMPAEQVEARISKIQDLINELERQARALVNASSVKGKFPYEASRWLPNGTRSDLTTWIGSVVSTLENVIEEADAAL